jgi:hypothetical protein
MLHTFKLKTGGHDGVVDLLTLSDLEEEELQLAA